jgi:hypothetical protein
MLAPRLLEGLRVLVVEDNLLLAEVTKLCWRRAAVRSSARRDGWSAAWSWPSTSRSTGRCST